MANPESNRRSLLKAAAALAAGTAAGPTLAGEHEDPELTALGQELERFIVEMRTQIDYGNAEYFAHEAVCEAAGLPELDREIDGWDAVRGHNLARSQIEAPGFPHDHPRSACDEHGCSLALNHLIDWQIHLVEKIRAVPPKTIKGLGIHAQAMSLASTFNDFDPEFIRFIVTVCAYTGVRPVAETLQEE